MATPGSHPADTPATPDANPQREISSRSSAGDVLLDYLTRQVAELRQQAPLVHKDAPDSVHQMRMAARRLRSALATGKKLFDDGAVEDIRAELKWLSGALGAARDPEVVNERLRALLAQEPPELVFAAAAERIDAELSSAAAAGRVAALEALDGGRYRRLLGSLDTLLAAAPLADRASAPAPKAMRKLLAKEKARVRGRVRALDEPAEEPVSRDVRLHEIRKAAKRVRYAAETARPVVGKKARRAEKAAHEIQAILGVHQDSVVARALLAELGSRALRSGENGFTYGRLHAAEEALARSAEADFFKAWKKFP